LRIGAMSRAAIQHRFDRANVCASRALKLPLTRIAKPREFRQAHFCRQAISCT
jgi:hypothetical protein